MKDLDYNILKNYLSIIYKKKDSKEINELCATGTRSNDIHNTQKTPI